MIEWVLIGNLLGIFSGLIPGLHVNTLAAIVVLVASHGDINWVLLIVAMAVMHSFVSFIPSTILGAGNAENYAGAMEGQKMFLTGNGMDAIYYSIWGGVIAGITGMLLVPVYLFAIQKIKYELPKFIPHILLVILLILPLGEKSLAEKFKAVLIMVLAGCIGIFCLRQFPVDNNLFVLISGLFGGSGLIYSMIFPAQLKPQKMNSLPLPSTPIAIGGIFAGVCGIFTSLIPGVGPSEASSTVGKLTSLDSKAFLTMVGGMDTANAIYGFLALYSLGKTRSGTASAIHELMNLNFVQVEMILLAVAVSIGIAGILTPIIAKKVFEKTQQLNYQKLNAVVLLFLLALSGIFSGAIGVAVFLTGSMIGLSAMLGEVKKSYCMSCIMVPILLYYFGI